MDYASFYTFFYITVPYSHLRCVVAVLKIKALENEGPRLNGTLL